MNKTRRQAIDKIKERIEKELPSDTINSILEDIEALRDEEQESLDNMPENLQGSERYETSEAAVDSLDEAYSALEELNDNIQNALDYLEDAKGE